MAKLFHICVGALLRLIETYTGEGRAAGDRKGTPEARAKSWVNERNLRRNRRMLSVLRRP